MLLFFKAFFSAFPQMFFFPQLSQLFCQVIVSPKRIFDYLFIFAFCLFTFNILFAVIARLRRRIRATFRTKCLFLGDYSFCFQPNTWHGSFNICKAPWMSQWKKLMSHLIVPYDATYILFIAQACNHQYCFICPLPDSLFCTNPTNSFKFMCLFFPFDHLITNIHQRLCTYHHNVLIHIQWYNVLKAKSFPFN